MVQKLGGNAFHNLHELTKAAWNQLGENRCRELTVSAIEAG